MVLKPYARRSGSLVPHGEMGTYFERAKSILFVGGCIPTKHADYSSNPNSAHPTRLLQQIYAKQQPEDVKSTSRYTGSWLEEHAQMMHDRLSQEMVR